MTEAGHSSSGSNRTSWLLAGLAAFVMIGGGVAHLSSPTSFSSLVPPFLPAIPVLHLAGVLQIVIGLAVLWPRTRALGGLAFAVLCTAYLPLHLWDYFRSDPVFAPPIAATLRVIVQALFIWAGISLWRRKDSKNKG